jgi:hypothetical protein
MPVKTIESIGGTMSARAYLFAMGAVVAFGVASAQAAEDPFLGTWKEDFAASTFNPKSVEGKALTVKREALGKGWHHYTSGIDAKGQVTHHAYDAPTLDGKDYPITGSRDYNSVSIKRMDANTIITVDKKDGMVVRMMRTTILKDGKTYENDQVGYNADGVPFHNVVISHKIQ